MRRLRMLLITTALTVGSSAFAGAQVQRTVPMNQGWGYQNQDRDRDWNRDRDRDDDRDRDRDRDRDWRWHRNRNRHGNYGNNGNNGNSGYYNRGYQAARQYGYQDGLNDGSNDRRTGHSFRPTQDSNYKHGDRGYSSSYGDKNQYKSEYRQSY